MKVLAITAFTPTPENKGGISALIYHLMVHRAHDINIELYSFNLNKLSKDEILKIENDLSIKIYLIRQSTLIKHVLKHNWVQKILLLFLKYPLHAYQNIPDDLITQIRNGNYDFVWLYPYFYFRVTQSLTGQKFIISGVDCISQVCLRRMQNEYFLLNKKRFLSNICNLRLSVNAEKSFGMKNIFMHYVGLEDMKFYKYTYKRNNAFFLLHPHYEMKDKLISFRSSKLKILIAGKNDFYMMSDAHRLIDLLCNSKDICKIASFTFLGKGWETEVERLKSAGYDSKHIKWVENYIDEIIKYDIQISPIAVGSGTKGKVLDAFANGLLVIGSYNALENICVRHNESCLRYTSVDEILQFIRNINDDRKRFESMASKGRMQVRTYHSPERIGKRFFEIALNIR